MRNSSDGIYPRVDIEGRDERSAQLERLLAARTEQCEAVNRELDALVYSISHDLRAAIQGVAACSRIVLEEHANQLDEEGKRWLQHVYDDSHRLDHLTAALLELSRVSRALLTPEEVDLSKIARDSAERLGTQDPNRQVDFQIADGLVAIGDAVLLAVVLDNLLSNAWKFTRLRERGKIEIGAIAGGSGEQVFFVRDNGVGFDMKYESKLFGVFQRLHSLDEFEGAGVGLAVVRRIVQRHGGRTWAEGCVGQGASMFFALPARVAR